MSSNKKEMFVKVLRPDLETFEEWQWRYSLDEVTAEFHNQLRQYYQDDPERGLERALEYVRFFLVRKNYKSFPDWPLFLPESAEMDIRYSSILQALKFPYALVEVLGRMFNGIHYRGFESRAAFRKGVPTQKFRAAMAEAMKAAFEAGVPAGTYEGGYYALDGKVVWVNMPPDAR